MPQVLRRITCAETGHGSLRAIAHTAIYYLPLGGADLVDYKVVSMMGSSPAYGYNVPGPGRSFNGRLTLKF